jgi:DUF4097 and DUF4098 domain-containing protein YvlB
MAAEPTRVNIRTRSGRVNVVAAEGAGFSVTGANVEYDADGSVLITGAKHGANRVEVQCATGTDLIIGTLSGHVEVRGRSGDTRVTTRSGRIDVEHASKVDVRTGSGHVTIGVCDGSCHVVTKSARVNIGRAGSVDVAGMSGHVEIDEADHAIIRTMSGRVDLGTKSDGRVEVRTLSGKVHVAVPRARRPATQLKSLAGRVHCECEVGNDGEIDVATTSGAISVTCK